ncbi:hypothetical protein [Mycobacterium sp. SMC-4]|uniref:hypothetical protein n=1 Tax=Mycobacterium sp. SMC-4 TaxID=2857059 RepID=UPI0021B2820E|nr:hypothetical protein [Mycobacterium sp. SMC-4]UXA20286.1 hypothetical protein KXD98_12355 [Mycobacterium sp. SMC-4]
MVAPHIADEVRHPLVDTAPVTLEVFDRPAAGAAPRFETVHTSPSSELTIELDAAAEWLGVQIEEILLAALGRTFGRTRGDGAVAVDVTGGRRWLCHPVSLLCAASLPMGPTELLQGAHTALASAPGHDSPQSEVLLSLTRTANGASGKGCALEVHVHRVDGIVALDWRFDASRLDAYSVEEMAEQFPLALIEITSDAAAPL